MSNLEKLRNASGLSDLASILGYKPNAISYILYVIEEENKYEEFEIPKKNGKTRKINAPNHQLKHLQRRLADLLNHCFDELSLEANKKPLSHGFRKNHSIITNANNHKNRRYVFNVDLQNFFPSINFGRVRGYFIKNNHFSLEEKVATIIAQIACHKNELPQGSPSSPIISNLIGHLLDIRMVNLAKKGKCTYSRYADDLTFSTNKKEFPNLIAIQEDGVNWVASNKLKREIEKVGFFLNTEKTSMQYRTARQLATGLVVNEKVNIKSEYYKNVRSMCHKLFNTGKFYIEGENANKVSAINQLEGILSFTYQVKRPHDTDPFGTRRAHPTAITTLYRKFLLYKYFYSLKKPVIICEGKTDIIYLKCALKQLSTSYSELVSIDDGKTSYKVSFLNYSKHFLDVFSISTGTTGLLYLMKDYNKMCSSFKAPREPHPVVIITDNDEDGGIKKALKIKNNDSIKSFYHYSNNMYVLIVPKKKRGGEIEDLFEKSTLNIKINGKSFSKEKEIDIRNEFGKIVFAEKIISEKQNTISFDGFKEVFDGLKEVINDCKD